MNTHETYVSLEVAKLLKKAGFDWNCRFAFLPTTERGETPYAYSHKPTNYNDKIKYPFEVYSAPTTEVAQRWLRDVHGIHVYVSGFNNYRAYREGAIGATYLTEVFDTYEQALEDGIKKCLTLILEG